MPASCGRAPTIPVGIFLFKEENHGILGVPSYGARRMLRTRMLRYDADIAFPAAGMRHKKEKRRHQAGKSDQKRA